MGAEPLPVEDHVVPDPLAGTPDVPRGRTGDEPSPEVIRQAQAHFKSRLDGIAVFLSGPANVVLQLSWPEVGHGVIESNVDSGKASKHPFKRFRTTIGYVGIAMLGSDELRADYREAVNAQHRQVRSRPDSPVKYNAFNRDLQLWVASCLYYGARDIMIRMHGPMTREEDELLLALAARFGTSLQVPQEMWFRDMDEFWAYWEEGMARCRIDAPVRDYFLWLLQMELLPFPLDRMARRPMLWFNAGFLVPEIREQLGIEWTERDQRRHDRALRTLGRLSRRLPGPARRFPVNAMMLNIDVRRRLGLRMA